MPTKLSTLIIVLTHLRLDKVGDILADDIFKSIFLNEIDCYSILSKLVPRSQINSKPALV